ncbi:MAG: hypothetical protein KC586_04890, partial [Myxococcales bacterium]|nr:hypothetical protein [Myxococcales bacterium]
DTGTVTDTATDTGTADAGPTDTDTHSEVTRAAPANPPALGPSLASLPQDDRPERLELALRHAAFAFDGPSFLSAQRAALVAVFEAYCGFGNLLQNQPSRLEIGIGIGCLVGAATLTYVAFRGFVRPRGPAEAHARYERFYAARREGLTFDELAATEAALETAARADRRRRLVGGIFGFLNFVAAGVLITLVARDSLDSRVGTSIATGTAVVGVLGVTALAIRGPSERALAEYRGR